MWRGGYFWSDLTVCRGDSSRTWQPGGLAAGETCCCRENGVKRRGPGALVSRPARLRGAFSNVESSQNPALCALSAGSVSVQASAEDRSPDTPPAGLGSLPPHQEQRAGPQPPGESGRGAWRRKEWGWGRNGARRRPESALAGSSG